MFGLRVFLGIFDCLASQIYCSATKRDAMIKPSDVYLTYPERPLKRQCDIFKLNPVSGLICYLSHYVFGSSDCDYPGVYSSFT